jgi:multiple sugar transport system permease protein
MKQHRKFLYSMAVLLALCWLVPIYLIGISALSPREAATAWPKSLLPLGLSFDTLQFFINYTGVWKAVLNSVVVALLTMLFAIVLGAPAGYALARYDFHGQNIYRVLIVMTRAFPLAILALPLVTRFISVGLYDTQLGWRWCTPLSRCRSRFWCRRRCSWAYRVNSRRPPGPGLHQV